MTPAQRELVTEHITQFSLAYLHAKAISGGHSRSGALFVVRQTPLYHSDSLPYPQPVPWYPGHHPRMTVLFQNRAHFRLTQFPPQFGGAIFHQRLQIGSDFRRDVIHFVRGSNILSE